MVTEPKVLYEQNGPVVTITINRPRVYNCVDGETAEGLRQAWLRFQNDSEAHVAVLTGAGSAFSSGADLKAFESLGPQAEQQEPDFIDRGTGYLGFTRVLDILKPTIAAIRGYCFAGGLEMAAWCDIRIAGAGAQFGCLERRFGAPLVDGGTQRLPRIIGMGRALDLIISGRQIDAATALAWGLVTEVVANEQVLDRARELAAQIAACPQGAIRTDKEAALRGWDLPLAEALRLECRLGMPHMKSADLDRFRNRPR